MYLIGGKNRNDVVVFLQHMVYVISILCSLHDLAQGLTAHLSYTTSDNRDSNLLPDQVTVTLDGSTDAIPSKLLLRRVPHLQPFIPLYTMRVDERGRYSYQDEKLKADNNTAFYQDVENEALFQIVRDKGRGNLLSIKGEVSIGGQSYRLSPSSRRKRDAPHTESYDLYPQKRKPVMLGQDFLRAPSEVILSVQEATLAQVPNPVISSTSTSSSSTSSSSSSSSLSSFSKRDPSFKSFPPHISWISVKSNASLPASKSSSTISSSSSSSSSLNRHTRQINSYLIDVTAVIDYGIYQRFFKTSPSRTKTLENVREYFAFIFSGVDLRYQGITSMTTKIRVRVTKIIVAETTTASTFTEQHRTSDTPWDEVDAQLALRDFSSFVSTTGSDMVSPYDHAMLFTGYDLTSSLSPSQKANSTTGLAYTSTMCRTDGKSVSVVEDLGGFQSVDTASHELGHSLSASHDGDGNSCLSSDRYIMAGGSSRETLQNKLNPWKFSSCSVTYFKNFINSQMFGSRGRTCLTQSLPVSGSVVDVSAQLPGQLYPPDEQCRMIYGEKSRLCRGTEFGSPSDVCTSMFCYDPSTTGTCYEQTAARGTTCGNGKICLNGECVVDSRAPATDDDCVFGDQPDTAFDGQTCADFVASFPGYCYQPVVRGRCCASCQTYQRPTESCVYGDSVHRCSSTVCGFATTQYLRQCCGTCKYNNNSPTSTSGTSRPTPPLSTRPTPAPPTQNPDRCVDDVSVLINQMSCAQAVASAPRFCYQGNVRQYCCASCKAVESDVEGCEYGDMYPTSCSRLTSCVGYESQCCSTCSDSRGTTTKGVTTRPTSGSTANPTRQTRPSSTNEGETPTAAPVPLCVDNPNIRVNNMTCQRAVYESPKYCYQANVQEVCCLSCKRANTGIIGCEYGDRFPETCTVLGDCAGLEPQCCYTCRRGENSAPGVWNRLSTPLVVITVLCVHLLLSQSQEVYSILLLS